MNKPLDELAQLVGSVLANRWLNRNERNSKTRSCSPSPSAASSATTHANEQSNAEVAGDSDSNR